MAKARKAIPKKVKEGLLKEFNHRCAVCGSGSPHIHHLDEDPSNNDVMNLIPLCPNCHLIDQHDGSNAIPYDKLSFFRKYKNRQILTPQFNALLRRVEFLSELESDQSSQYLEQASRELSQFVQNLEMGDFYSKAIWDELQPPSFVWLTILGDPESERQRRDYQRRWDSEYVHQLESAKGKVEELVVKLLDFQDWSRADHLD